MTDVSGPTRLFVAVPVPADLRAALVAHLDANGGAAMPGRHVVPANWHITLRFVGSSSPDRRDRLVAHLDEHLGGGPFLLRFGGLGAFPRPARATVAWLAVTTGAERLAELAAVAEEAARAAGFAAEERPFHAHLTLSRIRPPHDMTALVDSFPSFPGRLDVDRVTLFESVLGRGPAVYVPLEDFSL